MSWAFQKDKAEDTATHFHIFVGNLSGNVTDPTLLEAFAAVGSCSDARVMWDHATGRKPMMPTRQTLPSVGPSPPASSTLYLSIANLFSASQSTPSGTCPKPEWSGVLKKGRSEHRQLVRLIFPEWQSLVILESVDIMMSTSRSCTLPAPPRPGYPCLNPRLNQGPFRAAPPEPPV